MSKFFAKLDTGNSLSVIIDGAPYIVDSNHPSFPKLKDAVRKNDADLFLSLIDVVKAIQQAVTESPLAGRVTVKGDVVYYDNEPLHNSLTARILNLLRSGSDVTPLLKFLENLMKNPSKRAVDELYSFLEHQNLPITEDGCFIAYKAVKDDYMDKYSGRYSNRPGTVLEMPRNKVDDDAQRTCSYGFHVGSLEYSGPNGWYHSSSDKVLLVKVNPMDAVSVPADHSAQKLRVCKYEVIGHYSSPLNKPVYSGKGVNEESYDESEYVEDPSICDGCFPVSMDWTELQVGDEIQFKYTKSDGKTKTRYLYVTDIDDLSEKVFGTLLHPEEDVDEYRQFDTDRMTDIRLLD